MKLKFMLPPLLALAVLALTGGLVCGFDNGGKQYQFAESHRWIPALGAGYTVGLDGIALVLVVLTALETIGS